MPAAGAAGQGERGEVADERGAQHRREETTAVEHTMLVNMAPSVPGRASGARSERSERRREGYPPEGARPRSGLDRVARSRSDAPRLTVPFRTPASVFGTIDCITVGIVVVSTIGRFVIAAIDTGVAIDIATVIAARRTLLPSVARR